MAEITREHILDFRNREAETFAFQREGTPRPLFSPLSDNLYILRRILRNQTVSLRREEKHLHRLQIVIDRLRWANGSPWLTDLERSAIIKGIAVELANRATARNSGHMQATQTDRLQALIEDMEGDLFLLGCQLDDLEETIKNPAQKSGPEDNRENKCR